MLHSICRRVLSDVLCAARFRFPSPQLVIVAIALPLLLPAQRFFPDQQPLPASCQEWDYYQQLRREKIWARRQVDQLLERGRKTFSQNEFFYLQLTLEGLADRRKPFLADRLGSSDSPVRELISRLTPVDSLLAFEAAILRANQRLDQLNDICQAGFPSTPPPGENRRAEIALYRFHPGQVVAEIGAGNTDFAASLHDFQRGLTVFVNDIDTVAVLGLAYHFDHNPAFSGNQNRFFAILGTGRDTGLGPVKADRIIIRNAFHHFEDPQSMISSIVESLAPDGMVFLYERFIETCDDNCCAQLWSRSGLLDFFQENGFRLESEVPTAEKNRWVLGFAKREG